MKRGYKKGQTLPYKTRFCPYCGRAISKWNKHGNRLKKSVYEALLTCGAGICRGERIQAKRATTFNPPRDKPVDWFIYGRTWRIGGDG